MVMSFNLLITNRAKLHLYFYDSAQVVSSEEMFIYNLPKNKHVFRHNQIVPNSTCINSLSAHPQASYNSFLHDIFLLLQQDSA
uniref:Uncharacterized protein n=1 Tax=Cannabis sativa TaxID=3483 RepID=A0A803R6B4_CANSA